MKKDIWQNLKFKTSKYFLSLVTSVSHIPSKTKSFVLPGILRYFKWFFCKYFSWKIPKEKYFPYFNILK